jgi:large exoprotein involved in heme utilization and adhesion
MVLHNRTVYASPPVGGSGYGFARSIASLIPTQNLRHILPALVFATQSPYSGRQNVVNSRNVMRNKNLKLSAILGAALHGGAKQLTLFYK